MRRRRFIDLIGLGLALAIGIVIAGAPRDAATAPKAGSRITVRVLSAKVMKEPKFIGATVSPVSRGDLLTFREAQKDWYKVTTASGSSGWIHKSNVTEAEVKLSSKPGGGTGGTSQEEVELAGRGFTPEVEQQYRSKHGNLDFSHVDAIEDTTVDSDGLARFAHEGKVGAP